MPQNLDTIYNKMGIGGRILPAEELIVIKDLVVRLSALEEKINGLEKPTASRRKPSKVSKGEVPAS